MEQCRPAAHVWFPSLSALPLELAKRAEHSRSVKSVFIAAIDENIALARGEPLPEVKSLPLWFALLAWEPRIKDSSLVADLTDTLATKLAETQRNTQARFAGRTSGDDG